MKRSIFKIFIPILCAAILFTGCALARTITSTLNSAAGQTADPAVKQSGDVTASSVADGATAPAEPYETTDDNTDTQSADAEEASGAFSARDLSAEYDDETITVQLTGSGATADSEKVSITGSVVTITGSGTYLISGTLDDGSVVVDASKEDKVQLVLNGVSIHSGSYAAVYVKQADKVFITLAEGTQNTLSNGGTFTQRDDNNVDAVIFAKDDVTFNGTGSLTVSSPAGHGIVGKDEVTITGGVYAITSAKCAVRANDSIAVADGTFTIRAGTDGLHAENDDDDTLGNVYIAGGTFTIDANDDAVHANTLLQIDDGSFAVTGAEGLEGTYIQINGGDIRISATDDGVNAARKSSAYTPTVEINGGYLTVVMGAGDTDGVDSNGNIVITGGTVDVTGRSAFDYDGQATCTGGTIIVNGQQVNGIPNQMMGGGMMGGMPGGGRGWNG